MIDISIVIINYNTKDLTNSCIESIMKFTCDISYEIILVDNASADGSVQYFKDYQGISFFAMKENIGFGRANNFGVDKASGKNIFLLNSDTLLIENSVKILSDFHELNKLSMNIGVIGTKLTDEHGNIGNSGGKFPTVIREIKEYAFIVLAKIFRRKTHCTDSYDFDQPIIPIEYVSGANMFINRDLFLEVGGFDPAYFMYYEESDLQYRLTRNGYRNYLITTTSIIHLEGASTVRKGKNLIKRWIYQKSRNHFFKKNDKSFYPIYVLFDMLVNVTRLFNPAYSFRENISFIRKNISSY